MVITFNWPSTQGRFESYLGVDTIRALLLVDFLTLLLVLLFFGRRNGMRNAIRKGFTLIELLVVIAIIAMLIDCCYLQFSRHVKLLVAASA